MLPTEVDFGFPPNIHALINPPQSSEPTLTKVFAQPFRMAFKRGESVTWIEVRSLSGLRNVVEKLNSGEIQEIDRFSTLEMQLWGHLAEHTGFLRTQGHTSTLAAGIQPLGIETAALAEDLSSIMGGSDIDALSALDAMRETLAQRPLDNTPLIAQPSTHEFVKDDGVNLTEKGEDFLHEVVFGSESLALAAANAKTRGRTLALEKERENAIEIFMATPSPTEAEKAAEDAATKGCVDHGDKPLHEICKTNAVPPLEPAKFGPEATRAGRLVADIARGLNSEADKTVQDLAAAAAKIVEGMIAATDPPLTPEQSADLLDHYGVSMNDLKRLAGLPHSPEAVKQLRTTHNLSEGDLWGLVKQSEWAEDNVAPLAETDYECPDPKDPYGTVRRDSHVDPKSSEDKDRHAL